MRSSANSLQDLGKLMGDSQKEIVESDPSNQQQKPKTKRNNTNKNPSDKQLIVSRTVRLECYPIIATLKVMQYREDIVALLRENNLPKRLSTYLEKIDVISSDGRLTSLGKELQETKQLPTIERGLYHIWFCHDDPLIDQRPVIIQRIDAFAKSTKLDGYSILHGREDVLLNDYTSPELMSSKVFTSDNKQLEDLEVKILDVEVVCESLNPSDISLTWSFSDGTSSILLSGNIEDKQTNNSQLNFSYRAKANHTKSLMQAIAGNLEGKWDDGQQYLQLPLSEYIDDYEILNSFRLSQLPNESISTTTLGEFHIEHVSQLAIQPLVDTEKEWHESWLKHFYQNNHITPAEADKAQNAWLKNTEIISYNLEAINQHDTLQLLQKEGKSLAYWHAAASIDLIPNLSRSFVLPLHLSANENFDLSEIIKHLSNDSLINQIIISDRYYQSEHQQRFLNELAKEAQCNEGIFFALKNPNNKSLPSGWKFNYFQKKLPENHDRYWLFITKSGLYAWKVSTSLDFTRKGANDWQIVGHPSFTPILESDLPKYLVEVLENLG